MAYFEWSGALALGHPEIDDQHRQLLSLGEAVIDPLLGSSGPQPGAAQLQALIDFASEHFAFEEDLMRSAGYSEAEVHAKYHASLLTELSTYCHKVQRGRHANPDGLISFLWNWLVLHFDSADRELVLWLRSGESADGA